MTIKESEYNKVNEVYSYCRENNYPVIFLITGADKDEAEAEDTAPLTEQGIRECNLLGEGIKGNYCRYRTSGIKSTDQAVSEIAKGRDIKLEAHLENEMTKIVWNKHILRTPKPIKLTELEETYYITDEQEWYKEYNKLGNQKALILKYCTEPEKLTNCYKDIYSTSSEIYEKLKKEEDEIDIMFAISNEMVVVPMLSVFCPELNLNEQWVSHLSGLAIITKNDEDIFIPVTGI